MRTKFFLAAIAATAILSSATFAPIARTSAGEKMETILSNNPESANVVFKELTDYRVSVNIPSQYATPATVKIYSPENRIVWEETITNSAKRQYNFSNLVHGEYTILVTTAKETISYKYWR